MKKLLVVMLMGLSLMVFAETKQNLDNTSQAGSISESLWTQTLKDLYVDTVELQSALDSLNFSDLNDVNVSSIKIGRASCRERV